MIRSRWLIATNYCPAVRRMSSGFKFRTVSIFLIIDVFPKTSYNTSGHGPCARRTYMVSLGAFRQVLRPYPLIYTDLIFVSRYTKGFRRPASQHPVESSRFSSYRSKRNTISRTCFVVGASLPTTIVNQFPAIRHYSLSFKFPKSTTAAENLT